jgi:colicin import membrane protein
MPSVSQLKSWIKLAEKRISADSKKVKKFQSDLKKAEAADKKKAAAKKKPAAKKKAVAKKKPAAKKKK